MNHDYGIIGGPINSAKSRVSEADAIAQAINATEDLLSRVLMVVHRIAGSPPGMTDAACPAPPRASGVLPEIRDHAEAMRARGVYVSTELDRLEAML